MFGNEAGAVHDHAAKIARALAGPDPDPMNTVHLTEDRLKDDPARLADETQAISMFGGQRVVWLRDPGAAASRALSSYMEGPTGDALIVVEAGNLAKSSALRKMFESSVHGVAIPCYADSSEDLNDLISSVLSSHALRIDNDARIALVDLLGSNRAMSRSEIEKLALYCCKRGVIELADVVAACGDSSALSLDAMIDSAFEGDAAKACRNFSGLFEATANASGLLTGMARHVELLEALRLEVDGGKSSELAIKAARPPVFFKRQGSMSRQLRLWSRANLARARKSVFEATLQCRRRPDLEPELAERCLISIARSAQAAKAR